MKGSEKEEIAAIISCGDAAKMFEAVEATLDAIAQPVGFGIMANRRNARAFGRNDGLGADGGDEASNGIAVVASVGDHAARGLPFQKRRSLREIVGLAGRENEAQRSAKRIRGR